MWKLGECTRFRAERRSEKLCRRAPLLKERYIERNAMKHVMKFEAIVLALVFLAGGLTYVSAQNSTSETTEGQGKLNPEGKIESSSGQPTDSTYWLNKGAICYTYENPKGAIKYFEKAIDLDPRSAAAYFNKGVCHGEMGEYEEAVSCINKAIDMYPERALYFYGRGRVYLLWGDREKAEEDFKRAADLGDSDAQAYLQNTK